MDPDAQVRRAPRARPSPWDLATAFSLTLVLALGIVLRVSRFRAGDYYEDGSSHWWAAAYSQGTGRLFDPFNLAHRGYWLPGYDIVASVLMGAAGTTEPALLRSVSVGAYVAASLVLVALAAPAGRVCAVLAAALLAVSPFDALNSAIAMGVEPAVALLLFGLFLQQRSRRGRPVLLWGAALAYTLASLYRYEATPFVAVLLVYGWWWQGAGFGRLNGIRERPYLLLPVAAMGLFLAFTWGYNLPSEILAGPSAAALHQESLGLIPVDAMGRAEGFWQAFVPSVAAAFALGILGVALHLGREEAWLIVSFSFLLTVYLYIAAGTASFRYLAPVEPLMWLLAALSVRRLAPFGAALVSRVWRARGRDVLPRAVAVVMGVVLLGSSAQAGFSTLEGAKGQISLNGPLERAAAFLATLPHNESLVDIVDSPIAAEVSGLPASRMVGSAVLPTDREEALGWLHAHVQYVLAVNLSYYRLLRVFPELANRWSDANFTLLFDATGWEFQYTVKTAWVLEVNRQSAALQVTPDLALRFPFHSKSVSDGAGALAFTYQGKTLSAGTGLGYPTLRTASSEFVPTSLEGRYAGSPASPRAELNFTLHPRAGSDPPDLGGPPAYVEATYELGAGGLHANYSAFPPAGLASFTLRVNHSLLSDEFPASMNDSRTTPVAHAFGEALVWSLQNWLVGGRAVFQADFDASAFLLAGRTVGKSAWLTYEGPEGAFAVSFHIQFLPAGVALYGQDEPINLKAPLFRAGGYLAGAPRNASLRVLADFAFAPYPWVVEASGLGAESFVNTSALPASRAAALDWLRLNVDYLVAVNLPGDPLAALFPELLHGQSERNFSLAFDAGGGPGSLSHDLVWVYLVNGAEGAVPLFDGNFLTFPFSAGGSGAGRVGLGLSAGGAERVGASGGLAVPQAVYNGTLYGAGASELRFTAGSKGQGVEGTFWLYPVGAGGTLDRLAPPLAVRVTYAYADQLLNITANASGFPDPTNLTLRLNFTVPSSAFPVYRNDTDFLNSTAPTERSSIWSIRNWLTGPFVGLQADFTDPYSLTFERTAGGETTWQFEAPQGEVALAASVWLLAPDLVPVG